MKLVTNILRTGNLSISIHEGSTAVYEWHIDPHEHSKYLRLVKKSLSDPKISFPSKEKEGAFENTFDDKLLPEFLKNMPPAQISDPIWRSPSAEKDFTAIQRVLSRLQTAKPRAHGVEIAIAENIGGAATGHDTKLLSEYKTIKAGIESRRVVEKKGLEKMADEVADALRHNYVKDAVSEYSAKVEDVETEPLTLALEAITSEFILSANEGPIILNYLHELVSSGEELPVGSFCAMVQTINDMIQKGKKSTGDVKFGDQPDYSCSDGLQTRLALLERVIQTKRKQAGEASYMFATPEKIISVAQGLVNDNLKNMLLKTAKENFSFPQNKWDGHLTGIISLLAELTRVDAQRSSAEFRENLDRALKAYKMSTLTNPYVFGMSAEEADDFLRSLLPLMEAFCVELEGLFKNAMVDDSFKKIVAEQTLPFPPGTSAEGFLENTFVAMLTDPNAPLREIAGDADQKLSNNYKKEYVDVVKGIIKKHGKPTSIFLSDKIKMQREAEHRLQVLKEITQKIADNKLDYKDPAILEQITELTIALYNDRPSDDEKLEGSSTLS